MEIEPRDDAGKTPSPGVCMKIRALLAGASLLLANLLEGQLSLLRNTDPMVKPKPFRATGVKVGRP